MAQKITFMTFLIIIKLRLMKGLERAAPLGPIDRVKERRFTKNI